LRTPASRKIKNKVRKYSFALFWPFGVSPLLFYFT
jgi:hypothetical protein